MTKPARRISAKRIRPAETGLELGQCRRKRTEENPIFVRGKARRNTERFATDRGLTDITLETLYDAKAHFGR